MEAGDDAEWLLYAESDLRYAVLGRGEPDILQNQVAFHAQQAAEKALKAVLVHATVEFPRTHDLHNLLTLIRDCGIFVPPGLEQLPALTRFAVESRYPGDVESVTPDEVAHAIALAETTIAWVRAQIQPLPETD
ncbi:MAG TPA: HEPN domain-containing protein [Chthoniobacterales bacterium]